MELIRSTVKKRRAIKRYVLFYQAKQGKGKIQDGQPPLAPSRRIATVGVSLFETMVKEGT